MVCLSQATGQWALAIYLALERRVRVSIGLHRSIRCHALPSRIISMLDRGILLPDSIPCVPLTTTVYRPSPHASLIYTFNSSSMRSASGQCAKCSMLVGDRVITQPQGVWDMCLWEIV